MASEYRPLPPRTVDSLPAPSPGWRHEPEVIEYLNDLGVRWEFVRGIPLDRFDLARGRRNNARVGPPVDQQYVEEYAEQMRRGASFPAVVAFAEEDGIYGPAGGNHRIPAAIKADRMTADAYVIWTQSERLRRLIPANLNRWIGRGIPHTERLAQAATFMQQFGCDVQEAADEYALKVEALKSHLAEIDRARRILGLGLDPTRVKNKKIIARLVARIGYDAPLKAAFTLVDDAALRIDEVGRLIEDVVVTRAEASQVETIYRWRTRDDIAARIRARERRGNKGRATLSPAQRKAGSLFGALTTADNVLKNRPPRSTLGLETPEEYNRAVTLVRRISLNLSQLPLVGMPR